MYTTSRNSILFTDTEISKPPISLVKIHPLVIFSIADAFERSLSNKQQPLLRGEEREAIGVLYGEVTDNEAIVYDSFPCVPSKTSSIDEALREKMHREHELLFRNEELLGYYTFSQRQIDCPSVIPEGASFIHIWMKPSNPPKIDVFSIKTSNGIIVSTPIEYVIDASAEEQLGLSRLASSGSRGSLQAAIRELINLLKFMNDICQSSDIKMKDKLIGRQIQAALAKISLKDSSKSALNKAIHDIQSFLDVLKNADQNTKEVEHLLSLPID
ncbi:Mov34/MPN/PAD-1 family protein [Histomonas meleagridis]|uniref:Mov34/MPN/PAD-1 family protein n=1 Tax=Histomonas meleagridis TaxID=135588 RepID=UPI003559CD42|nr:Mov34/MPN/PAD-1 family protein [Histomonas meleagridis]KAH0796862.1 Mov34/MPN/PAD-1 family protein [Histomonas meleagridis]